MQQTFSVKKNYNFYYGKLLIIIIIDIKDGIEKEVDNIAQRKDQLVSRVADLTDKLEVINN